MLEAPLNTRPPTCPLIVPQFGPYLAFLAVHDAIPLCGRLQPNHRLGPVLSNLHPGKRPLAAPRCPMPPPCAIFPPTTAVGVFSRLTFPRRLRGKIFMRGKFVPASRQSRSESILVPCGEPPPDGSRHPTTTGTIAFPRWTPRICRRPLRNRRKPLSVYF